MLCYFYFVPFHDNVSDILIQNDLFLNCKLQMTSLKVIIAIETNEYFRVMNG